MRDLSQITLMLKQTLLLPSPFFPRILQQNILPIKITNILGPVIVYGLVAISFQNSFVIILTCKNITTHSIDWVKVSQGNRLHLYTEKQHLNEWHKFAGGSEKFKKSWDPCQSNNWQTQNHSFIMLQKKKKSDNYLRKKLCL